LLDVKDKKNQAGEEGNAPALMKSTGNHLVKYKLRLKQLVGEEKKS